MTNSNHSDIWILINTQNKDILGVYSSRDKAIEAGSQWITSSGTNQTFEISAFYLDSSINQH